jgi:hypothetical protein
MRKRNYVRTLSAAVLMAPLLAGTGLAASAPRSIHQSCNGVLTLDGGFYELKPDPGSGTWCDSYVADGLAKRVLKACAVGDRCHIEGSVAGHGAFYWIHISSVRKSR